MNQKIIEVFWALVAPTTADGCWLWEGKLGKRGTPLLRRYVGGIRKEYYPRQISMVLHGVKVYGRVESICKNKICLNPDHLASGDVARFWSKVDRESEKNCWNWKASKTHFGHGAFHYRDSGNTVQISASRYSWELHYGKLPSSDIFVCHKCDNPTCVNPSHLFVGSTQDNTADRDSKGRTAKPKGEKNAMAKVTSEDVAAIRKAFDLGVTQKELQDEYVGVIGRGGIHSIVHRKTWKHI